MIKKVQSAGELTSWFNVENYEFLNSESKSDVLAQFQLRKRMYLAFDEKDWEYAYLEHIRESYRTGKYEFWQLILGGTPNIKQKPQLPYGGISLCPNPRDLFTDELFQMWCDSKIQDEHFDAFEHTIFSLDDPLLKLDLGEYTDQEIMAGLERLLPVLRKRFDKMAPPVKTSKTSEYEKLLTYKIIPLVDLIVWEKVNNKHIPYRLLDSLLFGFDGKGESGIKQVVLPYLFKIMGDNFRFI